MCYQRIKFLTWIFTIGFSFFLLFNYVYIGIMTSFLVLKLSIMISYVMFAILIFCITIFYLTSFSPLYIKEEIRVFLQILKKNKNKILQNYTLLHFKINLANILLSKSVSVSLFCYSQKSLKTKSNVQKTRKKLIKKAQILIINLKMNSFIKQVFLRKKHDFKKHILNAALESEQNTYIHILNIM